MSPSDSPELIFTGDDYVILDNLPLGEPIAMDASGQQDSPFITRWHDQYIVRPPQDMAFPVTVRFFDRMDIYFCFLTV